MGMTNYLENAVINLLRGTAPSVPAGLYLALFTTGPTDSAGSGAEVSGGAYVRKAVTLSAPTDGTTSNSAAVNFPTATANWGTITHVGIFDAVSGGNLLVYGALAASKTVVSGEALSISTGNLDLELT